jgi:hypothetical protein
MKIIEALKRIKELNRKAADLTKKVKENVVHTSLQTPPYGENHQAQVDSWIQAHRDIVREILALREAIQYTNLMVGVNIEIDGKIVTKSIAAWIHRRRDLAGMDAQIWKVQNDQGIREGVAPMPGHSQSTVEVKLVRYYNAKRRDEMMEMFTEEPHIIDARLEIVNATTDLLTPPPVEDPSKPFIPVET